MKFVLVSDTHGRRDSVHVPHGDVLIHAGDLSSSETDSQIAATAKWLGSLPHRHKIAIAGNHDFLFQQQPTRAATLLRSAGVIHLLDSETSIGQLFIYGSPWQPEFMHWAFNLPRGQLANYWKQIPTDLDILITHGPPHGILDQRIPPGLRRVASWEDEEPFPGSERVGDEELLAAIERVKPPVHVFGHIHSGYGRTQNQHTAFYNASLW